MKKVVLLLNLRSLDYLPVMERWLLQVHAPETISRIGPWLTRYHSYLAVPPPPAMHADAEAFGYYNWRVTELWSRDPYPQHGILPQEFFPDYKDILGLPSVVADAENWHGGTNGLRQSARFVVPARASEDFKGGDKPVSAYRSILRWFTVCKLPPGVSVETADRWYLDVHAREVLQQPGLTRFTSHSVVPASNRPWNWYRLSEFWYESFSDWRHAIIEAPPRYTPPPWAAHQSFPFFKPYVDFASTFLLESPTNTMWPPYRDYLVGV